MDDNAIIRSLEGYSSLTDPHLVSYFSTGRMRRHLRRAGLILENGEVVSETNYQLSMTRKAEEKQEKSLFLRAIADRKKEIARQQRSLIVETMDNISKMEKILKVKSSKAERQLPLPPLVRRDEAGSTKDMQFRVGGERLYEQFGTHGEKKAEVPSSTETQGVASRMMSRNSREALRLSSGRHRSAGRQRSATRHRSKSRQKQGTSEQGAQKQRSANRKRRESENTSASKKRAKITLCYYGTPLKLETYLQRDARDEVLIEQQHCGGSTLIVFRGKLLAGDELTFTSRRHTGFPFSVTIFVNGVADCRISACCEYRHRLRTRLGTRGGHFAVTKVEDGAPCLRCALKYAKKTTTAETPSSSDSEPDVEDDSLRIDVESEDEDIIVRPVSSEFERDYDDDKSDSGDSKSSESEAD